MTAAQAMELDRQVHENTNIDPSFEDLLDHITHCNDARCDCEAVDSPDSLF